MRPRWPIIVLLLVCLAIAGGSGYALVELRRERDALTDQNRQQEQKIALLQRGYAEQKALAAGMQRTKVALEAQKLSLERQIAEAAAEKQTLAKERDGLTARIGDLEKAAVALHEQIASLQAKSEELDGARADLAQQLDAMTAARQRVDASLKRETHRLEKCAEHNEKLTQIAQELMEVYREKGVMSALMDKEPLIGVKKIELDNLINEYQERVEQEHVDERRPPAAEGAKKEP